VGSGGLHINPATRLRAGQSIQTHHFAHPQAAAIQKLDNGGIAQGEPRVVVTGKLGQLHRIVYSQCFGQGFGGLGCAHIQHRIDIDRTLTTQPRIKATPARQNQRNAAPTAPLAMHLRHPAANVCVFNRQQGQLRQLCQGTELLQIERVQSNSTLCQALFYAHIGQIGFYPCRIGLHRC